MGLIVVKPAAGHTVRTICAVALFSPNKCLTLKNDNQHFEFSTVVTRTNVSAMCDAPVTRHALVGNARIASC